MSPFMKFFIKTGPETFQCFLSLTYCSRFQWHWYCFIIFLLWMLIMGHQNESMVLHESAIFPWLAYMSVKLREYTLALNVGPSIKKTQVYSFSFRTLCSNVGYLLFVLWIRWHCFKHLFVISNNFIKTLFHSLNMCHDAFIMYWPTYFTLKLCHIIHHSMMTSKLILIPSDPVLQSLWLWMKETWPYLQDDLITSSFWDSTYVTPYT